MTLERAIEVLAQNRHRNVARWELVEFPRASGEPERWARGLETGWEHEDPFLTPLEAELVAAYYLSHPIATPT